MIWLAYAEGLVGGVLLAAYPLLRWYRGRLRELDQLARQARLSLRIDQLEQANRRKRGSW